MNKKELINIVSRIYQGPHENAVTTPLLDILREALPHAKILNLLFHDKRNLSPEEVIEEAIQQELDYISKNSKGI